MQTGLAHLLLKEDEDVGENAWRTLERVLREAEESQHTTEACSSYQERTFWEQQGA